MLNTDSASEASHSSDADIFSERKACKLTVDRIATAKRFIQDKKLVYCQTEGWALYDGHIWISIPEYQLLSKLNMMIQALAIKHPEANIPITSYLLKDILNLVKYEVNLEKIPAISSDLIPCLNKFLLWDDKTQNFVEVDPSPKQYVFHPLTVKYDPQATHPKFDAAIKRIMPCEYNRRVVQMYMGASLFSENRTRKFMVFIGEGSTGKSMLIRLLQQILGQARCFDFRSAHLGENFALSSLTRHHTMLSASEAIAGTLCGHGGEMIKKLVGGDEFASPMKHKNDSNEFIGRYSLFLVTNHKLRFEFDSKGKEWSDRLIVIYFRESIPDEEKDLELVDKLYKEEGSGILNWLIEGARMVRRNNWTIELTKGQRTDRDNLIASSKPVQSFVQKFISPSDEHFLSEDAYELYNRLHQERHLPYMERMAFMRKLAQEMVEQHNATVNNNLRGHNGKTARGYKGFSLARLDEQ